MAENPSSGTASVQPSPTGPSPARHFVAGSIVIVPMLILAMIVGQQAVKTEAAPAPAPAAEPPSAVADPAPAATVTESKGMKAELADLTAQLKKIQTLVEGLPKPEPSADLKPIEGKVDELSRWIAAAAPLSDKVDKLGGRIGDMGKQIESLRSDLAALKQRRSAH